MLCVSQSKVDTQAYQHKFGCLSSGSQLRWALAISTQTSHSDASSVCKSGMHGRGMGMPKHATVAGQSMEIHSQQQPLKQAAK